MNRLEALKASHPEWCWTCGKTYLHPGSIHTCFANPLLAALVTALEEVEKALAEEERGHLQTIDERDSYHEWADKLAYTIAPEEVIGEHSSANNPWANALEQDYSLRAQLTAERERNKAMWDALEELVPCECVFDVPGPEPTSRCPKCRIRAALKGGADAEV